MELEPQCHKDPDCILEATEDVSRQKLTRVNYLYHIDHWRISSEDSSSKLESSSFYHPCIAKSICPRDSLGHKPQS